MKSEDAAHKEADLIKAEAKVSADREIATFGDRTADAKREYQRAIGTAEKAKSELRNLRDDASRVARERRSHPRKPSYQKAAVLPAAQPALP